MKVSNKQSLSTKSHALNPAHFRDVSAVRSAQAEFFKSGGTRDIKFRLAALERLEAAIETRSDKILKALATDLGKPGMEAWLSEIYFVIQDIRLFRKKLKKWAKPVRVGAPFYHFPIRNEIRREPFGCSLIISPWNYPFQLSIAPLVAAVAAGNCAILKPSELAPATSKLLQQIVSEVFDPAHVIVVEGDSDVSRQLLAEPMDFVFFTGSEKAGKSVARAAAENLAVTVLELGGKCPVIVDRDVDLRRSANRIAAAKFFNAGQTCFSPDFVVAHKDIQVELASKIVEEVEQFYTDDGRHDMAQVVNGNHYKRLSTLITGEDDCFQFGEDDPDTLFFAPRILTDANWESPVMQEEIFGPILPILGYTSEDQLIEKLRTLSHPLALYLFSRSKEFTAKFTGSIQSGSVGINDLCKQTSNLELPFGGVGGSGMGRYRGKFGFDAFTYQRPVSHRWFVKDLFKIQPPYAGKLEKKRKLLK